VLLNAQFLKINRKIPLFCLPKNIIIKVKHNRLFLFLRDNQPIPNLQLKDEIFLFSEPSLLVEKAVLASPSWRYKILERCLATVLSKEANPRQWSLSFLHSHSSLSESSLESLSISNQWRTSLAIPS
jgi:hypothetical protein